MKICVNLDSTGISIEKLVSKKLEISKLPECMGKMTLPILKKEIIIDDEKYKLLQPTQLIPVEDRINPESIVSGTDIQGFSLVGESFEKINKIKEDIANDYISKVSRCINCSLSDTCFKLTSNYLISISLLMGGNK